MCLVASVPRTVSCLHPVVKRKGTQDEEATRSRVRLNQVLDTLLSN